MSILLDTHTLIWLANGNKDLNAAARKAIIHAMENDRVYLASISMWEISMLSQRGRIILGTSCSEWINKALRITKTGLITLTPDIAAESYQLPGDFHGDPADRIIVASARVANLKLVTRDQNILEYGKKKFLLTLKA